MNASDIITKIVVGLFVGTIAIFCVVFLFALHQNSTGAHYNVEDIKSVGQLITQQILYFFGIHSGANTQWPVVGQFRNPQSPINREVTPVATGSARQHPDNG